MKQLLLLLLFTGLTTLCSAQLKAKSKCPAFEVELLTGKVNGMKADRTSGEFLAKFPCATSSEPEASGSRCGGFIFFKDKDIYFYTGRNYIEIKEKFQGKLDVPLMGSKRGSSFKLFGHPKVKDDNWDAYQTGYGTLVLYYNAANKVNKIQFSTNSTDALQLCE